jgi:hypothetical protein
VSAFGGAGLRRRARKIRQTVASLTWYPSRVSSPCTLRYPQAGFSRASRSTSSRISRLILGRPDWFGYVHLRVIRRRVPGQQRARRDQPVGAQHGWQQPGQRRQHRPVGPVRLRPGDLAPEHRGLMAEHHDLRILGRLAATQQ